ncbi:MAG TPA: amino acid transporter [Blastocatellia bacterium]|nr:amino acid transporter [Blastocatellia bacterium]
MAEVMIPPKRPLSRFKRWFFEGQVKEIEGPHEKEGEHHTHTWWQVMCLTGVDYFSTLGYQPGIAALAAGLLSPVATLILVLLTLFGALPIYRRVAAESPHGEGSISMLEKLLSKWKGKLFVLVLLGFVATDFIITITLSAADATEHIVENPFVPHFFHHHVGVTLALIAVLAAVFLKGFKEAIGIAVFLVGIYLLLNLVIIGFGFYKITLEPHLVVDWKNALFTSHGSPVMMIAMAMLVFPKLALGLSGFETGVAVMPLVKGDKSDSEERPVGRIRNTRRLLLWAALIMSVFLISSSLVTTLLIPAEEFQEGGKASGRALAFLAHEHMGEVFGTAYDVSTILILWFAGASAMAGLLNIVPRYLPRYGMAPEWTRATRPLVLVFTVIAFAVTVIFNADVNAQGGAYATGVLVLMSSAAIAVTLSVWRKEWVKWAFLVITLVFAYTTIVNVIERPDGVKIASFFIAAIIFTSFVSRIWRTTELRVERIELDEEAEKIISEMCKGEIRLIANQCDTGDADEYKIKEEDQRKDTHIPKEDPVVFFEVRVADASEFTDVLEIEGKYIGGYRVLRAESSAVPNAIAAFLLYVRDRCGKTPHIYFEWTKGNPLPHLFNYLIFGEGDTGPVTREVLRQAEPDYERRPFVHVGGE